jgi:hypothetical protein
MAMSRVNRRDFMRIGAGIGAFTAPFAGCARESEAPAASQPPPPPVPPQGAAAAPGLTLRISGLCAFLRTPAGTLRDVALIPSHMGKPHLAKLSINTSTASVDKDEASGTPQGGMMVWSLEGHHVAIDLGDTHATQAEPPYEQPYKDLKWVPDMRHAHSDIRLRPDLKQGGSGRVSAYVELPGTFEGSIPSDAPGRTVLWRFDPAGPANPPPQVYTDVVRSHVHVPGGVFTIVLTPFNSSSGTKRIVVRCKGRGVSGLLTNDVATAGNRRIRPLDYIREYYNLLEDAAKPATPPILHPVADVLTPEEPLPPITVLNVDDPICMGMLL